MKPVYIKRQFPYSKVKRRGITLKTEMQKTKVQLPSSPCNIHPQTKKKEKKKNKINKYRRSGVFIANFEHISHLVLVLLLLTVNMYFQQAFFEENIKSYYCILTQEIPTVYSSTLINFT